MSNLNVYQIITDRIVSLLAKGVIPWRATWNAGSGSAMLGQHRNAVTGHYYRSTNAIMTFGVALQHGYTSPLWLTFKQALALGGHVKKGEKGTPVLYASRYNVPDEKAEGGERAVPFLKYFSVFNVAQCEGLPMSKQRNTMKRFAGLAEELARSSGLESAIFDGEIVVLGESGPDFDALFSSRGVPQYAAFDLLWLNGEDLRPLPFHQRKARLKKVVRKLPIGFVEAVRQPALFQAAVQMDLEGIVAKRRDDPYSPETVWVKVKHASYSQMVGRAEKFHGPRR